MHLKHAQETVYIIYHCDNHAVYFVSSTIGSSESFSEIKKDMEILPPKNATVWLSYKPLWNYVS